MAIVQFRNLLEKKVDNDRKVIIDEIMKAYNINDWTHKTNKKIEIIFSIRYVEAI